MTRDSLPQLLRPGCLRSYFQPVIDIAGPAPALHSLEALTRGLPDTNFNNAAVLFEYVRRKRAEPAVDRECVKLAFSEASWFATGVPISVNVHASTFARDPDFPDFIAQIVDQHQMLASRVCIEIVEYMAIWGQGPFTHCMHNLQKYGFKVAIDDLGSGHSNFRMILDTSPAYLKLDSYIVRNCHEDKIRLAIIDSVVSLARNCNCRVIAEGVEDSSELAAVTDAGITLIQGYYFCRPVPAKEIQQHLFRLGLTSASTVPISTVAVAVGR
jgi:EAL domain-containing protein (putative c-di-GMP-specific phosphodiesterase class I)